MKNIEDFLNEINEKSWRQNIEQEASRKFEELIETLQENKKEILEEIVEDVKSMEKIKLDEDNESFNYSIFQTWLDYCSRNVVQEKLREKDD